MNEKIKAYIKKQNQSLVDTLSSYFSIEVYKDEMAEDEEPAIYHFFIYELGNIKPTDNDAFLSQDVFVHYISEKRVDIEENTLDIIALLRSKKFIFGGSTKGRHQKANTDAYVDRVSFSFRRMIKIGCPI